MPRPGPGLGEPVGWLLVAARLGGVLPPEVLCQLRGFADELDGSSPGVLDGLYAVGSVALGDFYRPLSNIDALALAAEPWSVAALDAVRRASRVLRVGRQPAAVACVTWADLAGDPAAVRPPCFRERDEMPSDELVNPFTWQVLRTAGVCVRGPEYPDIGPGDLRAWAVRRLSCWWADWLRRAARRPGALWLRRRTTESVLEVARLSQVVSSGRVVSKVEAGDLAVEAARPAFQRILKDSVGFRRGVHTSMYWGPFERKTDALAFVGAAIQLEGR